MLEGLLRIRTFRLFKFLLGFYTDEKKNGDENVSPEITPFQRYWRLNLFPANQNGGL